MDGSSQLRPNSPGALPVTEQPGRRLDSWKEIAAYLGRSEKTVRRWEKKEALPVHRLLHEKRGSVYAYTGELDAWREARKAVIERDASFNEPAEEVETRKLSLKGEGLTRFGNLSADETFSSPAFTGRSADAVAADAPPNNRFGFPFARLLMVAALSVLVTGLTWFTWRRVHVKAGRTAIERIQSLAVLPLENLSGKAEEEYFADGMTAELITELARIASLRVISRNSAMRYKRTRKPLIAIARELNVDALVEGEVLKTERRVRISAQLIEPATDRHLWAETYVRDLRDAVELQGEVVESLAKAIKSKVTPEERARLIGKHRVNPEAYEAYLQGRFFWNQRTQAGLKKSIEYFQSAIQKDPSYAVAYSALADSYDLLGGFEFLPSKSAYSKAKATATKALRLDDTLGEAHTVLGDVMYEMDWDWSGAEREFGRAIELSPGDATAHQRYSLFLMSMQRSEESLIEIGRAQALNPLAAAIMSSVGWRLVWARRYDEAIKQLQKTLDFDPNFGRTHMYLGWAYEAKGDSGKAIDELRKATALDSGSEELASLAHAYAFGGHRREARDVLQRLQRRVNGGYATEYLLAVVYAGLGENDRAFESLAKSCKNREDDFVRVKVDPMLDVLRSDPRFRDLVRCAGLT